MRFWYDFASTYSYLAAMRIDDLARDAGIPVEWSPFLLGPIFERQGWSDSPYNLNPVRGRYMWRDIERLCAKYRLGFGKPSRFPRNSVLAGRVACAAAGLPWLPEFSRAVFRANFAEDRDIADPAVLEGLLGSIGLDGPALLAAAVAPENRGRLRRQTEIAWEQGIFGAPTFVVGGEIFWGHDRLEDAFAWHRSARA